MIPTIIYPALKNYAPLNALIAARIHKDRAGDSPTAPYVVWSDLVYVGSTGISEYRGYADRVSVTIDTFARDRQESDDLWKAARDAAETIGKISSGPQNLKQDEHTKLWRYTMTVDVFLNR